MIITLKKIHTISLMLLTCIAFSNLSSADPTSRVARLSYIDGTVLYSPIGAKQSTHSSINQTLSTGDHIYASNEARTDMQLDSATFHIDSDTSLDILKLDDKTARFKINQGGVKLRIWKNRYQQGYEIYTPNRIFYIQKPGNYLIEVAPDETAIQVFSGEVKLRGSNKTNSLITENQSCEFNSKSLKDYQCSSIRKITEFDNWCTIRDEQMNSDRS